MATAPIKGKIFQEPVNDLTFPGLGKTAIFKLTPGPKLLNFITTLTVTGSATGAGTKTVPRSSWGIGDMRFKLGNFNRTRRASEVFGANGLQARNSLKTAGTVQYFQGGTLVTATLSGRVVGGVLVLIDNRRVVHAAGSFTKVGVGENMATGLYELGIIRFPVFLTRTVFDAFVTAPPNVSGQDEAGRLWDIVWMLRFAARLSLRT